jgi:NTE family protein
MVATFPKRAAACACIQNLDTCISSVPTAIGSHEQDCSACRAPAIQRDPAIVTAVSTARVDLVCEGGGVRGIGLVGAVDALAAAAAAGYEFPRVAGASAGAIVASLVAALQAAGEPLTWLAEVMRTIDHRKFLDRNLIGHVPLIGGGLSLLVSDGVYRGAYLEQLLAGLLGDLGMRTFGDLRTEEEPEQFAWSLVVIASDLSRRRLVRIPRGPRLLWHRPGRLLGGTRGARLVGDSVRVRARSGGWRYLGRRWLLSNFPVELFDRSDGQPRWPTFGIRLSARPGIPPTHPVHGPVSLGIAAIETLVSNQDDACSDDACTVRRTIFVRTDLSPIDFDITAEQREALYQRGLQAGQQFLKTWNFADYLGGLPRPGQAVAVRRQFVVGGAMTGCLCVASA